ncbi:DUF4625 domain-containing protein [Dyadobacter sediminis]|uniref:DUF4625 domain-containing protein n=1 Tax=Dyadobacter sediminis TaxID=1493691 RepID=A0A5R9KKC7_9BACT|nr:DUF4625 domain-containing protein [Dyadobacter sediminis]TLU96569.1 DUF4625 domain-containing protein [Dyadobacter sediminis]
MQIKSMLALLLAGTLFASCNDDDDVNVAAPTLSGVEIGSGNNKQAHPGSDFHIEAQIVAPGGIERVQLEIHPVNGSGWKLDTVYTEGLAGLKNAELHKHIDVPASAALGKYDLHLTVTDKNGNKAEIGSELDVINDPSLPAVTGFAVEAEDAGKSLHLEAAIAAPNKIAAVTVEVHGEKWEKEFEFKDAAMVGQTAFDFHKHLDITAAPAGHYHVHLKVTDQAGKENEFEEHFDK